MLRASSASYLNENPPSILLRHFPVGELGTGDAAVSRFRNDRERARKFSVPTQRSSHLSLWLERHYCGGSSRSPNAVGRCGVNQSQRPNSRLGPCPVAVT